jgi:PKD repeat protein
MMKKIFVFGLIVCSFLVVSISPVIAASETHTITDATGDVIDSLGDTVSGKNDIDVKEVSCTQDGKNVELKLTLATGGNIQNSSSVTYLIVLINSENRYDAMYGSGLCIVSDLENEIDNVDYSGEGTDTLTISFDLSSSSEEYVFVYAVAYESTEEDDYVDYAPSENIPLFDDAGIPETGVTGESISFSANASYGTDPYTFLWNFGDGKTSNGQTLTHTYDQVGTYKVIVLVTDTNDYSDVYYGTIEITAGDGGDQNGGDNNGADNDGEQESSNSGMILFVVIIAVIAIAGIAVVVYIIRR